MYTDGHTLSLHDPLPIQCVVLRDDLGGIEMTKLIASTIRVLAAAALLAAVSYFVWDLLDEALGRGIGAQIVSLGRSEEHTSELQSLMRISYAVFCLKKKQTIQKTHSP